MRRKRQPTPAFFPGESHGQEAWQAIAHEVSGVKHDLTTKPPPPNNLTGAPPCSSTLQCSWLFPTQYTFNMKEVATSLMNIYVATS